MPGVETRAAMFLRIHRAAEMFIANVEELPEGFIPRFEAETAIAVAAHHLVDGLASLDSPPNAEEAALPIHIERAFKALGASVGRQLDRWGWTYPRHPDGLTTLNARLDRHHTEKERPFLQAVRTWREAPDVEPHGSADRSADRARALGIPADPALTPEEAKELTWQRHRAWFRDSIALASDGEKPADSDQAELDAMKRFVDDIGVFARNLDADQRRAEVLERARSHALDRLQAENPQAAEHDNGAAPPDGDRGITPAQRDIPQTQPPINGKTFSKGELDAMATAKLMHNPSLTNAQIAAMIGCHVKSLSNPRLRKFRGAREMLQRGKEEYRKADRYERPGEADKWEDR